MSGKRSMRDGKGRGAEAMTEGNSNGKGDDGAERAQLPAASEAERGGEPIEAATSSDEDPLHPNEPAWLRRMTDERRQDRAARSVQQSDADAEQAMREALTRCLTRRNPSDDEYQHRAEKFNKQAPEATPVKAEDVRAMRNALQMTAVDLFGRSAATDGVRESVLIEESLLLRDRAVWILEQLVARQEFRRVQVEGSQEWFYNRGERARGSPPAPPAVGPAAGTTFPTAASSEAPAMGGGAMGGPAGAARRHGIDFRSVVWDGTEHAFTPQQAACVRLLWEAMENATPDVAEATILEKIEAGSTVRVSDMFRGHGAWDTVIVEGRTKGTRRLADPNPT